MPTNSKRPIPLAPAICALFLAGWSSTALAQEVNTYVYDALGRLTNVLHANGAVTTYRYDAAGNRTEVVSVAPPTAAPTPGTLIITPLLGYTLIPKGQ